MSRSGSERAASADRSEDFKRGPRDERGVLAARILAVARDEFAANGYQGTSIRAIARGADVDPGLVYHYYGGKEALLAACVQAPPAMLDRIREAWQTPAEALGTALVTVTLANWSDPDSSAFLRTMVLTAAHHAETRAVLRGLVQNQLMGPATIGTDADDARRRASLIASQLLGLGVARYVWGVEPLASMTDDEVIAAVGPTIQRYVDGRLG
ncbi:TetR/AcrR family transcriptional regulator [Gordonia aichiensis]|uniref:TetR/AcrR family transcriptional regulator n=1 Tax=Gordonia aichiensis TaxID=36820 RepID=UPI0015757691|nr:TetR family transcriptional regulator [Gordonia aichiensis]